MNKLAVTIKRPLLFGCCTAWSQDAVDENVIARIKMEGFQNSKIMETLFYLTDVYGPRLRGSLNYRAAADWAVRTLSG